MRVLVLVGSYPPVLESAARLYSQLSESLAEAGHTVTVISECPSGRLPVDRAHPYFSRRAADEMSNGVRVLRVSSLTFLTKIWGGNAIRFLLSCGLYAVRGLLLRRQDVVLVYLPPLFMGVAGHLVSIRHRARLVLNVQDIHPKVLFDSNAIRNRLIKAILIKMETFNYRNAYSFIVYSSGNREYLLSSSVKAEIHVIPNWVDRSEFLPVDATNRFRDEDGIGSRLLVSYVGTMQSAQGLEIIIAAAELLRAYRDIVFLLAGEGTSKPTLARLIEATQLDNVLLRPMMPADRYVRCLQASDVCLVTLGAEVPLETVPGKLAYAMACAKPLLAAVNLRGDAAKIILEAGSGLCVNPGDSRGLADAVLALYRDSALRQEMGQKAGRYAESHFSRGACTRKYEQVLLAAQPSPA